MKKYCKLLRVGENLDRKTESCLPLHAEDGQTGKAENKSEIRYKIPPHPSNSIILVINTPQH